MEMDCGERDVLEEVQPFDGTGDRRSPGIPVELPHPVVVEAPMAIPASGTRGAALHPTPSVARRFLTTVMFVDVVDSTRRAVRLGDTKWLALQETHEAMARREVQRHAGRCLNTLGDGLVASFASAAAGVRCAASIVEASRALGIEVRAGLHSGECERRGSRLGGIVFHVGARVLMLAAASEVLVSRTVTDLVAGAGFVFGRRGVHRLKGLPGEWPLYAFIRRQGGGPGGPTVHGRSRL
jgi:class 3 adenylate cyclase